MTLCDFRFKQDLLAVLPDGAYVTSKGQIKIIFALLNLEYIIPVDQVAELSQFRLATFQPPPPMPPTIANTTETSLEITWQDSLPYAIGIITVIEVQFECLSAKYDLPDDDDAKETDDKKSSARWQSLVTKHYHQSNISSFTMDHLLPGRGYRFRTRYRCPNGWSPCSQPSAAYRTRATAPDAPQPPVCLVITPYAAELRWFSPVHDNGKKILSFILQGRSSGDNDYHTLYQGSEQSYLAQGLYPEFVYSFRIAAINAVGISEFSKLFSFQTPQSHVRNNNNNSSTSSSNTEPVVVAAVQQQVFYGFTQTQVQVALQCRMAWSEFWDPRTDQAFYFNSILALRQLERPPAWDTQANDDDSDSEEDEEERVKKQQEEEIKLFQRKRFRLVRSLHQYKQQQLNLEYLEDPAPSVLLTGRETVALASVTTSASTTSKDHLLIHLRRDSLLQDFQKAVKALPQRRDILKRIKVQFTGEEGIDSGGLGKEAFLLLSKAISRYGLRKGYLVMTKDSSPNAEDGLSSTAGGLFFGSEFIKQEDKDAKEQHNSESNLYLDPITFANLLGIVMGKAIMDRQLVEFPLSSAMLKHMLGKYQYLTHLTAHEEDHQVDEKLLHSLLLDIKTLDVQFHQSMVWILENSVENVLDETFSVLQNNISVPLCPNGGELIVDDRNKMRYVLLMLIWKLQFAVHHLLVPFLKSFHYIVPLDLLLLIDKSNEITEQELSLILNGKQSIHVEEIRAYCMYQSAAGATYFHELCDSVVWFWRAVREMTEEERRLFLLFFTGSSRLPLDGYDPPITITDGGDDMQIDSLPRAHTCFNQFVLPRYSKYELLKMKLLYAIRNTEGFGFA